jgi:plastocyanin domain-containing protein
VSVAEWSVLVGGLLAVAWIQWYFFLAGRTGAAATVGRGGVQEAEIVVRGGYTPAEVRLQAGRKARIVFDRQEESGCSEEVVLPDFGIRRFLPPHEKTAVELLPERAGTFEFTCGMGMLRGRIVVEPARTDPVPAAKGGER